MNTSFEKVGDVLKVSISGRLVAAYAENLREDLQTHLEENRFILLDLSQMDYIDSSGLGVLVWALQQATTQRCILKIAGLQSRPRIVFDITKVSRIFEIYDSVPAALASFYKDASAAQPATATQQPPQQPQA